MKGPLACRDADQGPFRLPPPVWWEGAVGAARVSRGGPRPRRRPGRAPAAAAGSAWPGSAWYVSGLPSQVEAAGPVGRGRARGARSRARGRGSSSAMWSHQVSYQPAYDVLAGRAVQGGRGRGGLGGDPVHPLADDGVAVPVDGVDEPVARRRPPSPRGPTASNSDCASRRAASRARRRPERGPQVQGQPGPLQPVADGRAVRAERVRRARRRCTRAAGSTWRRSARGSASRWPRRGRARPASTIRSARSRSEASSEHVGGREQRLDRVHVGVDAAVAVERRPVLVPLLDDHAVLVVPEGVEQHRRAPRRAARAAPGRPAAVALAAASTTNACS